MEFFYELPYWNSELYKPIIIIPLRYQDPDCLKARAAYDIGSGATKIMAALVNVCTLKIDQVFSEEILPLHYRRDLYQSENNEFSASIQNMGLKTLAGAKTQIEQKYHQLDQYGDIQHCAVATAAFRVANNGETFAHHLSEKLEIPINVISLQEEAILAYYGALSGLTDNLTSPIVWDIGGGSMQLTFKDEIGQFYIMGSDLASETFNARVLETISHKQVTESPNPMSDEQVQSAITLAKKNLIFEKETKSLIQQQITQGKKVVAVGSVHNLVVQPLIDLISGTQAQFYTKEELLQAIILLTNKTDPQIMKLMHDSNELFVKNYLTNLILVYSMMEILGIDEVQTIQTSNVQGLLLKGCP